MNAADTLRYAELSSRVRKERDQSDTLFESGLAGSVETAFYEAIDGKNIADEFRNENEYFLVGDRENTWTFVCRHFFRNKTPVRIYVPCDVPFRSADVSYD